MLLKNYLNIHELVLNLFYFYMIIHLIFHGMKKILFILFFALLVRGGFGNPIEVFFPDVRISEFYINASGQWQLEISIDIPQDLDLDAAIDSLFLESNSGIVKIKPFPISSYHFLVVIDQEGIYTPIQVGPDQDHLILHAYVRGVDEFGILGYYDLTASYLNYGYPDSHIPVLLPGQSICFNYYIEYYKDSSPTIGFPNDNSDTYGYLTGRLFDINLNVVTNGAFMFVDGIAHFVFDAPQGYFTEKIYAKNWNYSYLYYFHGGYTYHLSIDPVQINMEVDSTVIQDVYLLDTIVGLPEITQELSGVSIIPAPNPCRDETNFFINIPDDISYTSGMVTLYENSGKKIRSAPFSGQWSFTMQFSMQDLPQGVYFYSLSLDNKSVKSGQLLVVR